MLERLLHLAAEGGVHSYQDLAERLSVSLPLLEAMLADLARLGYLRAVEGGCTAQCTGCPMGGCAVAAPGRIWVLTAKGSRAAAWLKASG